MYRLGLPLFLLLAADQAAVAGEANKISFNRDIRPLLSENCFACHGPDASSREADLRLDRQDSALENGAIVSGDPDNSELIARITSSDDATVMPPRDSNRRLESQQIELLKQWIREGAQWEAHWAFLPPSKSPLPTVNSAAWVRNPIDHFVLAKLEEAGLEPNGQEELAVLARRVALDLTGLPPDPSALQRLSKNGGDAGYRQYVRELLASVSAGEHRARYWLDAARYGDTHGMHLDNYREIWPYRDWVINAFANNMPFDEFVLAQVAGDLLAAPTAEQQIATGFNRCNITTSEGGAIPEELDVRYMVDRVETTATVFLGLTAGCAVCHDHKYDPISQREFYQLGAFFANTTQPAMDGNQKDTPPVLVLPSEEFAEPWRELQQTKKHLVAELSRLSVNVEDWWPKRKPVSHPVASDGLLSWLPLTNGEDADFVLPEGATWADDHPFGRGVTFGDGNGFTIDFPQLRTDEPLTISFWCRTPDRLAPTTLFDQTVRIPVPAAASSEKPEQAKEKKITVGWKIASGTSGNLDLQIQDRSGKSAKGLLPDNEALRPRQWQHVCVRYSGGQSKSSMSISVDGSPGALRHGNDDLLDATDLADVPLRIAGRLETAGLSDIRIFSRWLDDAEVQLLADEGNLRQLLASESGWEQLSQSERELATRYYRGAIDKRVRDISEQLAEGQRQRDFIYARSTTTLVMAERPAPPRAWVLARGEYDQRGEEVMPGVPSALPSLPSGAPSNRLGLAQWLVSPDHPLTARVMVNRLWQSLFGTGLVKTSEDFGVMGDRPSHPQLLDWLAVEFIESGWDVRHMLELMVTSAAYRQSAHMTPAKYRVDPDNRLLARGPRVRLDAEVLRDQALAVSGLLRGDVGGPSVKPYQPAGLWKVIAFNGSNTDTFQVDSGDALYRRSLYTFWKRTSPPPSLAAFNAPTREQCTVRRERTNTPLQALVLLNDTQFVEAARHLAERTLRLHHDERERARWIFRAVLSRSSDEDDTAETLAAVEQFTRTFQSNRESAQRLVATGESAHDGNLDVTELAAWTMVANVLMNRDDFINK